MTDYQAGNSFPDWPNPKPVIIGVVGAIVGFLICFVLISHRAIRKSRKTVEHCVLIGKGSDYHDVECPSGTWRYYGDTLHIRLHTCT